VKRHPRGDVIKADSVAKKAFDNRTQGVRRGGVCIGASENGY